MPTPYILVLLFIILFSKLPRSNMLLIYMVLFSLNLYSEIKRKYLFENRLFSSKPLIDFAPPNLDNSFVKYVSDSRISDLIFKKMLFFDPKSKILAQSIFR